MAKVNPLIGSAGVSAVPMAARVSQKVGAEADPTNFLLMHAMGPNVAGVIGTAVATRNIYGYFRSNVATGSDLLACKGKSWLLSKCQTVPSGTEGNRQVSLAPRADAYLTVR